MSPDGEFDGVFDEEGGDDLFDGELVVGLRGVPCDGRWESTQFNSRLQPVQIALGVTQGTSNLLKLDYSYGTTANNGNVLSQTITVPTVGANTGFTAVQNYNYDSLNRLKDATENVTPNGGSASQSWKQTFTFDRYGNRRFDIANTDDFRSISRRSQVDCGTKE